MTAEELKQLAREYVAGKVWTAREIPPEHLFTCFVPLSLLNETQRKEFVRRPPALVYEYTPLRSPLSVKGYPIFRSCRYLYKRDLARFDQYVEKFRKALTAV